MPKRNLDIIRELLLTAESVPLDENDEFNTGFVDFMGELTPNQGFNLALMRDAGLIEGKDANIGLFRVTNAGHDYLDAVKNDGIWAKTKSVVEAEGGSLALELIKSLALSFGRKQIEDRTGLKL